MNWFISLKPEIGKYYQAKVNGYDCVLRYDADEVSSHHCATCTCSIARPSYTLIDGPMEIGGGPVTDVKLIQEIDPGARTK